MYEDVAALRAVADPKERAAAAGQALDRLQVAVREVSRVRRESVEELLASGLTQARVATLLGMSRGRVSQLLSAGPPPERAFFGDSTLTVAMGAKFEAGKDKPGSVLAKEDFEAFNRLNEMLTGLQLDAQAEMIPPPGMIRLNRPNLVVMCGPRLSPLLGQILESDPNLGFECVDDIWVLRDFQTGDVFRSPMDDGEPADVSYLGRLPRPDGKGTFIYMAGIHAPGPAGVIHHLNAHLAEIYREVKDKRFSTLIHSTFDRETGAVVASRRLTPLYTQEA